ncbi:alpha/beta fold hydrolase [Mycobacterium simiae]|uniref:alpha/beta fold hydrolase n=1 Tax=Mycobacterium simiae TaxID=1784 RepID=UPI0011F26266|nr:alpha/beta fold hydrolase [Mycobacterium simiae]
MGVEFHAAGYPAVTSSDAYRHFDNRDAGWINQPTNFVRRGTDKPLLLAPGLGSDRHDWQSIMPRLVAHRDVIAVDLPGFSESPPISRSVLSS